MTLKDILERLGLLKQFNKAVTEEAQKHYITFKFRCHNCELILDVEAEDEWGAIDLAIEQGWAPLQSEVVPGFVRFIYLCKECKVGLGR